MKKLRNTDVNIDKLDTVVTLYGWVLRKRDLGGVIFIDLKDISGVIQLVISPENKNYEKACTIKTDYVLKTSGKVVKRSNPNKNLKTGDIEIEVEDLEILNVAENPIIDENSLEETKLKYRYVDLRRSELQNNFIVRHKITKSVREYLDSLGFIDIETPMLTKSTPEGARDYIVPSRVNKGCFYALPQSPQIFKQLLMVAGFEKYYQIAKCFRDEDLRADRQPEFTQIDLEMSFVSENDVMDITENLLKKVFKDVKDIDIQLPLTKMKYDDAIDIYGTDKPDLRFEMKINDISNIFESTEFELFKNILDDNGIINCIVAKDSADKFSRKDIDKLGEFVKTYQAKSIFWLKYNNEFNGGITNKLSESELSKLKNELNISDNDMILIIAGNKKVVKTSLGALRCNIANKLGLIKKGEYKLLWITDFPVFEWSDEENRYQACHHPFTAPKDESIKYLLTDKDKCYAKAYDIVINGYEAGGGSIRIHDSKLQELMFESLGFTKEKALEKFGFLIEAFKHGTPPHGGLALGLDRLTMLMLETDNIKDVIAFPKTTSASCLMTDAPNTVDDKALEELHIKNVI